MAPLSSLFELIWSKNGNRGTGGAGGARGAEIAETFGTEGGGAMFLFGGAIAGTEGAVGAFGAGEGAGELVVE